MHWYLDEYCQRVQAGGEGIVGSLATGVKSAQVCQRYTPQVVWPGSITAGVLEPSGKPQVVEPGGTVEALGLRFRSDALLEFLATREPVLVKLDPSDVKHVYVYRYVNDAHGWKMVDCSSTDGGCPCLADIPWHTGRDLVAEAKRADGRRKRLIKQHLVAEDQQRAVDNIRWRWAG